MITQTQSDGLLNYYRARIAAKQRELAAYCDRSESTNRYWQPNEDSITELENEIARLTAEMLDAEKIETISEDVPAVLPTMATARLSAFALGTLAVLGLFLVGAMFGVAVLFNDSDWRF